MLFLLFFVVFVVSSWVWKRRAEIKFGFAFFAFANLSVLLSFLCRVLHPSLPKTRQVVCRPFLPVPNLYLGVWAVEFPKFPSVFCIGFVLLLVVFVCPALCVSLFLCPLWFEGHLRVFFFSVC